MWSLKQSASWCWDFRWNFFFGKGAGISNMLRMLIQTFIGPKSLRQCVKLAFLQSFGRYRNCVWRNINIWFCWRGNRHGLAAHSLAHITHRLLRLCVCPSLLAKILEAFTGCQHGSITAGSERPPFSCYLAVAIGSSIVAFLYSSWYIVHVPVCVSHSVM